MKDATERRLNDVGLLTDHHRDIPALDIVGHPLLVSPTDELKEWNQNKKAPVLSYEQEVNWSDVLKI